MADFKVGDTVQLKSGGPVMTVTEVADDMGGKIKVFCTWFDEKGNEKNSSFQPETVEIVEI